MREDDDRPRPDAPPRVQREDHFRLPGVPRSGPCQGFRHENPENPVEGNLDYLPGRDELPEPGAEHWSANRRADHPSRESRGRRGDVSRRPVPGCGAPVQTRSLRSPSRYWATDVSACLQVLGRAVAQLTAHTLPLITAL